MEETNEAVQVNIGDNDGKENEKPRGVRTLLKKLKVTKNDDTDGTSVTSFTLGESVQA
jgi:hypothetical protein